VAGTALRRRLTWRLGRVVDQRAETATCSRISLRVDGWGGHLPGQHVDVRLTAPDGYQAQRSYSIASAPEAATVDLVVQRVDDGEVSPYLTDVLRRDDLLELRGPIGGHFVWHADLGGPLQLIAGGSGVAPFLAMLDHRAAAAPDVPARLLVSVRRPEDLIGRDRLDRYRDTGVAVDVTVTRTAPPGWDGRTGRVTAEVLGEVAWPPSERPHVFVCGPTGFVEAVADALVATGHDPRRVKTERFG